MLKVKDVNASVTFWQEQGASLRSYNRRGAAETAFVSYSDDPESRGFALELSKAPDGYEVVADASNFDYIGISAFAGFRAASVDLDALLSSPRLKVSGSSDPNGFLVKSVPAGPGDPIARLCFRSSSLDSTASFYAQIFGLREVARSETELCLRYPTEDETTNGNPTTLVFRAPEIASTPKAQDPHRTTEDVASETNVLPGFDHLVIGVDDCERAFSQATAQGAPTVMPVSTMFGQNVAMVKDPNGISVAIVSALRQD